MTGHPGEFLDDLAASQRINRMIDRAHIETAILSALEEHDGLLTIAWVRQHITRNVTPHMVGAVMSATVTHGGFEWTGQYAPNGGPSGNGAKPAKIWRSITQETS